MGTFNAEVRSQSGHEVIGLPGGSTAFAAFECDTFDDGTRGLHLSMAEYINDFFYS